MSDENLALYLFGVIILAACFAGNDSTAWIGVLIFLGGVVLAIIYGVAVHFLMLFNFHGKKKRKRVG